MLGASLVLKDRSLRAALWRRAANLGWLSCSSRLLSMLLAPTMMLFHSEFVLRALLGRSVGWDAQPRGDRGVTWREALSGTDGT